MWLADAFFYLFAALAVLSGAMVIMSRNPVHAVLFLILAFFQRFRQSGSAKLLDPMQQDAYGMFLVHYPIALWLQYWLFDYDLPAIVKATVGFVLTVAFSWALTRALRQIPGASKVL